MVGNTPLRTRQALSLLAKRGSESAVINTNGTTFLTPEEVARQADMFERTGYGAMLKFFTSTVFPWATEELVMSRLKKLPAGTEEKVRSWIRMIEFIAQKYTNNVDEALSGPTRDAIDAVAKQQGRSAVSAEMQDWFAGIKKYLPQYVDDSADIRKTIDQLQFSMRLTDGMSYADKVFLLAWTYYSLGITPDGLWEKLGVEPGQVENIEKAVAGHLEDKYSKRPEETLSGAKSSAFGGPGILSQYFGEPRNKAEAEAYDILYGTYGESGLRDILGLFDLIYSRTKGKHNV